MHDFTPEEVRRRLRTVIVGRRLQILPRAGSTNDLGREAGRRGEPEGLVIAAEEQVAGRGRLGRTWVAPPGCCVLCSVLLRPRFSPERAFYLTVATSLAIYRSIKALGEGAGSSLPHVSIKWPNDVLVGGKKIAGVLSESEFLGGDWAFTVAGFGVNANLRQEDLGDLGPTATSLLIESRHPVDRAALLASILNEIEPLYLLLQSGRFGAVHDEWSAALDTPGRHVTVLEVGGVVRGKALGVDPGGALVVRLDDGTERHVLAGDVLSARSGGAD